MVVLFSLTMAEGTKLFQWLCPAFGNHTTAARGEEPQLSMQRMPVVICRRLRLPLLGHLPIQSFVSESLYPEVTYI